jgi:eukaryotic-like serine/threonine-protein kinase
MSTDAALFRLNALKAPGTREAHQRALDEYERLAARLAREFERAPDRQVAALARDIAAWLATSDATGEFRTPTSTPASTPTPPKSFEVAPTTPPPAATVAEPDTPAVARSVTVPARAGHPGAWRAGGWRRRLVVLACLAGLSVSYLAVRSAWGGSDGSLIASGVLRPRERVLVADFDSRGADSLLGRMAAEAFRIDLGRSPVVTVVQPTSLTDALARMKRPSTTRVDAAVAREVAVRSGIRAVLSGDVVSVGPRYVFSAQLVAPSTGDVLAADRETARDSTEIIAAVDRLSGRLRGRIGESLRALRENPPLEQVTTGSLEALRKYSQAVRAADVEGDHDRAAALLEDAIALDSGFAMAYRKLALVRRRQSFLVGARARMARELRQALVHKDRLSDRERYLTLGVYYSEVTFENDAAIAAFRALLESYPDDQDALHSLGRLYLRIRQYAAAEGFYRRAIEVDTTRAAEYSGLINAQVDQGKWQQAESTLALFARRFPQSPEMQWYAASLPSARWDFRTAEAKARLLKEQHRDNSWWQISANTLLANIAGARGRIAEAERYARDVMEASVERKDGAAYLLWSTAIGGIQLAYRHDTAAALATVERALAQYPLDSIQPVDRPYLWLAWLYATAGRPARARAYLTDYERLVDPEVRRDMESWRHAEWGEVALAEGRLDVAIAEFRAELKRGDCPICGLPALGRAYEQAGQLDSAIAIYERYLTTPFHFRLYQEDVTELGETFARLGALYDQRGDRVRAAARYARLAEIWQGADPELRPQVELARRRASGDTTAIAAIAAASGRRPGA